MLYSNWQHKDSPWSTLSRILVISAPRVGPAAHGAILFRAPGGRFAKTHGNLLLGFGLQKSVAKAHSFARTFVVLSARLRQTAMVVLPW